MRSIAAIARVRRSALSMPSASSPSSTFCSTVNHGNSANDWNTMATPFGGPWMVSPRHIASPEDGDQACDDPQQRRLARSGTAEQPDDLAGVDGQVDLLQHGESLAASLRKRTAHALDVDQAGF